MEAFIEAVKEAGRLALISIVSYLLTAGVLNDLLIQFLHTHLSVWVIVQIATYATILLRGIDSWLHEHGKATNNLTMTKGLVRF